MTARYDPPTRVSSTEIPLLTLILRLEPDFLRTKHRELEDFGFTGRRFFGDPSRRGAYTPDD